MIFDDLCMKIYFWPFLSYLASLKGICPYYPNGALPITTLPPITITSTTPIPTYQPTPPITLPPCPADPLVCLTGGVRPISYCPCIDPRQSSQNTTAIPTTTSTTAVPDGSPQKLLLRVGGASYPSADTGNEMMIFSHLDSSKGRRKRSKRELFKDKN